MVVSLLPTIPANILKTRGGQMTCMLFALNAKCYGYFYYCFWGWGALAQAKEGQRENFK